MLRRLFFTALYLAKPPWDTGISPPELVAFIQSRPPGRSLDLGCGTGTNVITLAQHGWQAAGIDFIPRAIRQAQRKAQALGLQVDLRVGDAARMAGLDGPYDLVLDMGCFHGLKPADRQQYCHNLVTRLAKDGAYLLYGFLSAPGGSMPGITQVDLDAFGEHLELISRQVGSDHSGAVSAWLTYHKHA